MSSGTTTRDALDHQPGRAAAGGAAVSLSPESAAREILDASSEPVWAVNPERKLIFFNRAFASVLEQRYGVLPSIGDGMDILIPSGTFPHDYAYWNDLLDRAFSGRRGMHEFSSVLDDRMRHFCISCYDLSGGLSGLSFFARDVTDLREAEERSYELGAFSERIFEASPIGIMSFDEKGSCSFANSASSKLFALPLDVILGNSRSIIPGWYEYELTEAAESALDGSREVRRTVHIRVGGKLESWFDYRFLPFTSSGKKNLLLLVTDITESRQIEEDTILIMRELKQSNDELERFAYVASHDLQEPLRVIASYLQLLERRYADRVDDKGRDFIVRTVGAAKRMQGMIEDLLGYSRVMTRGGSFEAVPLDDALSGALQNLGVAVRKSRADISSDSLPVVQADKSQMVRVFQNLIGNAIKFQGDERPRIRVSCAEGEECWTVSIRDNGIGIAPEFHKRIFQVFQRLHSSDRYGGSGIGLAVCQRIIERHGGRITVDSAEGKGSVFSFTIPRERKKNARI